MSTGVEFDHSAAAASSSVTSSSPARSLAADPDGRVPLSIFLVAAVFWALWSCASYFRWANFGYRTFDLAYYVQAVWQLIHGRFALTVENVPLLGNHVEPIVFLFAPIFALVRHPMLFVAVQNVALAAMAPLGYLLARQLFDRRTSALLSLALLLAPASGFVALHEFHPEALSAPLLLLLIYARTTRRAWLHWLSFLAVLACKENMALLLVAYCTVFLLVDRDRRLAARIHWYGIPLLVAATWFLICTQVITPALNSGNIDYLSLYDRLGKSPGDIVWNAITRPQLAGRALFLSLTQGNLVWGLLLPFGLLPLLRPRWILIAAPIFLQHLLSWRSSEWSIYFHYAAPVLPLMWIAAVEALLMVRNRWGTTISITGAVASVLVIGCIAAQLWLRPAPILLRDLRSYSKNSGARARKQAVIAKIPAAASVVAPLPYLSHLAMREKLYSLHYILKGLKTLSRQRYEPPARTDFVLIDYDDDATFDPTAGYYHPQMHTADNAVVASSDQLLHEFLREAAWTAESTNELTLFRNSSSAGAQSNSADGLRPQGSNDYVFATGGNELQSVKQLHATDQMILELRWQVTPVREIFPWMILRLSRSGSAIKTITKGLCAIDVEGGPSIEHWQVDLSQLPAGDYAAEALFVDNPTRAWQGSRGGASTSDWLVPPISLGKWTVPVRPP